MSKHTRAEWDEIHKNIVTILGNNWTIEEVEMIRSAVAGNDFARADVIPFLIKKSKQPRHYGKKHGRRRLALFYLDLIGKMDMLTPFGWKQLVADL